MQQHTVLRVPSSMTVDVLGTHKKANMQQYGGSGLTLALVRVVDSKGSHFVHAADTVTDP